MDNSADAYRAEIIKQTLEAEDWNDFLFAHDEEQRFSALIQIEHRVTDAEYWKLVRLIWTHADAIWRNGDRWRELLTKTRSSRHEIMEEKERAALLQLDDPVLIFRGHAQFNQNGWSWTRTWGRAKEFAKTPKGLPDKGTPKVTKASVERAKVIAYFTLLDEEEVLIDPNDAYVHESVTVNPGD